MAAPTAHGAAVVLVTPGAAVVASNLTPCQVLQPNPLLAKSESWDRLELGSGRDTSMPFLAPLNLSHSTGAYGANDNANRTVCCCHTNCTCSARCHTNCTYSAAYCHINCTSSARYHTNCTCTACCQMAVVAYLPCRLLVTGDLLQLHMFHMRSAGWLQQGHCFTALVLQRRNTTQYGRHVCMLDTSKHMTCSSTVTTLVASGDTS
jgi:hypothetical protein